MAEYHLTSPLKEEEIRKLKIGDTVYLSGNAFTCRSRLQRYIFDEAHTLPFDTTDRNLLIHNGPIIIKEQGRWKLVSFMPTSSIRFEKWGAKSVKEWGLRMIVGKTTMGAETAAAMKEAVAMLILFMPRPMARRKSLSEIPVPPWSTKAQLPQRPCILSSTSKRNSGVPS